MNKDQLQTMWRKTLRNIEAPVARLAERCTTLTAIKGDTLHLSVTERVTQKTADKLAYSLYLASGNPVAVVMVPHPVGQPIRGYGSSETLHHRGAAR